MMRALRKIVTRALILLAVVVATALAMRLYAVQSGPPLAVWHTFVPRELRAKEIDAADWDRYLAEEARIFETLRTEVTQKLDPADRVPLNRYFEASPIYPAHFAQDFNRSYIREPEGPPVGAAVLLHGLTDSPYSLRHIAQTYREHGFVAITIRLPGHGTVPAGLTDVDWEDWLAATRLAVREARRRTAQGAPLHLVGFSNGGALALKYALDAIADPRQPQPDRIVLISPMIGVTRFAQFAGFAGLPAVFPPFAKAAWLSVVPEFNPFKYNSFPVNGARQTSRLTGALQEQIAHYGRTGQMAKLPPIMTFQSVMDSTVSTSAIVSRLYDRLPANGSELVLFDVNRAVKFGQLLRRSADTALARLLPPAVRPYRVTIITNGDSDEAVERTIEAGTLNEHTRPLGLVYPPGVYSLSHVALPFPINDALYGMKPDSKESFGINLGALAPRGERNVLIASLDVLLRVSSNPFFPYMEKRVSEIIDQRRAAVTAAAVAAEKPRGHESEGEESPWSFSELGKFVQSSMQASSGPKAAPP